MLNSAKLTYDRSAELLNKAGTLGQEVIDVLEEEALSLMLASLHQTLCIMRASENAFKSLITPFGKIYNAEDLSKEINFNYDPKSTVLNYDPEFPEHDYFNPDEGYTLLNSGYFLYPTSYLQESRMGDCVFLDDCEIIYINEVSAPVFFSADMTRGPKPSGITSANFNPQRTKPQ